MNFADTMRSAGLIPRDIVADGRVKRCDTQDKPGRRNGWYALHADGHGVWGDWAQGGGALGTWRDARATWTPMSPQEQARQRARIAAERSRERRARQDAAGKAGAIIAASKLATHPYLVAKGFPEHHALVWGAKLVVPMRIDGATVGVQLIDEAGDKKFLYGQQCKGAVHAIGNGEPVWCEGYATALSIQAALTAARLRRRIVVCFSAGNLQHLATRGFVVADNDASGTGQRVAAATGLPYWMSDRVGEDFNDAHRRLGTFRVSQLLKLALMRRYQKEETA
jgi:putative DNA primase/helicase